MKPRDDFVEKDKRLLAQRAGFICSNPECNHPTVGAAKAPDKKLYIGRAAHITAAATGGPRYDESLTIEQRCHIDNAIYLCTTCADLIDQNGGIDYPIDLLRAWRQQREEAARRAVTGTRAPRRAPSQPRRPPAPQPEWEWFTFEAGSWGSNWANSGPEWRVRQLRGEEIAGIDWRFRSRYQQPQEWRHMRTHHFDRSHVSAKIDYSQGEIKDDPDVGAWQLGLELRYRMSRGWRRELHIWPVQYREPYPGKQHVDLVSMDEYSVRAWMEDEGNGGSSKN